MPPTPPHPNALTLHAYQVGFGDCYLLAFHYPEQQGQAAFDRFVLIDFGSTALPSRAPKDYMVRVARDIAQACGGKLHAVVATHRHADHINGFARREDGQGPGDIIRNLQPDVVVQPWTEAPDAERDARSSTLEADPGLALIQSLAAMNAIAEAALQETPRLQGFVGARRREELSFLGEVNLSNKNAVENLMTMGQRVYVYHGSRSGLEDVLPGVKVHVLGPPTLTQSNAIRKQRDTDPDEFWHLQARASSRAAAGAQPLFPGAATFGADEQPPFARWLIPRLMDMRGDQLLEIVRILDGQMNNTSIILLFETANRKLLFPGDAQIENWSYALKEAPDAADLRALLADVDLYKVGHHGSLNATPKTLWNLFAHKGPETQPERLQTLVSTKSGKHGSTARETEVPRETLVDALVLDSHFQTTQDVTPSQLKLTLPPIAL